MRHHRSEEARQGFEPFAEYLGRTGLGRWELVERVGQFANPRHGAVEAEFVEVVGDGGDRLVRRAPDRGDWGRQGGRHRRAWRGQRDREFADHPPQPVDVAPDTLDPSLGPFEVALWRAVRQQIKPRRIRAISVDYRVEADDVLLRLAHFFMPPRDYRPPGHIDQTARAIGLDLLRK